MSLVILLLPCHASAADKLLGIHSARTMSQSMPWIAEEAGLFKKYDLDFQLVYISSASMVNAAMLSGSGDVAITGRAAQWLSCAHWSTEIKRRENQGEIRLPVLGSSSHMPRNGGSTWSYSDVMWTHRGQVEGTARTARNLGYDVVILKDCVGSRSREQHDMALKLMESAFFEIATANEVAEIWRR